jgi:hypothetical protein
LTTVSVDLDGVLLKTTLRLILKQLGQAYIVRDGGVTISSTKGIWRWKRRPGAEQPPKVEPGKTQ